MPKEEIDIEAEGLIDQDEKFKHKQMLYVDFFKKGSLFDISYSNISSYQIREDLLADMKIKGGHQELKQPCLVDEKFISPHCNGCGSKIFTT